MNSRGRAEMRGLRLPFKPCAWIDMNVTTTSYEVNHYVGRSRKDWCLDARTSLM